MNLIDLVGQRFGKLTVIKRVPKEKSKPFWEVECDCGKRKIVRGSTLKAGQSTSCGSGICNGRTNDISGQRFGKLIVLKYLGIGGDEGRAIFSCQCDCGKKAEIEGHRLLQGLVISCTKCPTNTFYSEKEYMVGYTAKGEKFIIDNEDFAEISKHNWWASNGYLFTKIKGINTKMHRFLLNPSNDMVIDHKDGNPLNNRRNNIRVCTQGENCLNSSIRCDSFLQYKGLKQKKNGKYEAGIQYKGIRYYLGIYETQEEAALAYNKKAIELNKDFFKLNDIK